MKRREPTREAALCVGGFLHGQVAPPGYLGLPAFSIIEPLVNPCVPQVQAVVRYQSTTQSLRIGGWVAKAKFYRLEPLTVEEIERLLNDEKQLGMRLFHAFLHTAEERWDKPTI